jgi:DDE superfamily endonuclease
MMTSDTAQAAPALGIASPTATAQARRRLDGFRREAYRCLSGRADALFELCDALLCASGPVTSLAELSLQAVHRRGHGAMYDALAAGRIEVDRLRMCLAGQDLPRDSQGRMRLAVDVTPWPRPNADCSPQRCHCHRPCRCDGVRQTIPGWPYSIVAALESGRCSWTAPLDALRLRPYDDLTEVTAAQIRDLLDRLREAGQLREGDPPVLVVLDAGYDVIRLAHLLADLPVQLLARLRCDRVFYAPAPPRQHGPGRPPRHGGEVRLADPTSHPTPDAAGEGTHPRYGAYTLRAFARLHPRLARRGGWSTHPGPLPIIEGSVIAVRVQRLPGQSTPKPLWLWHSNPDAAQLDLPRLFAAFLRRFDLEHTFRFFKQTLGWTRPRLRTGDQADRWTWLVVCAYTQLRLSRALAEDLRRPWEKPLDQDKLTPGRIRRGFPRIHPNTAHPANAPKPTHPGPGRPKGSPNKHRAPHYPVGKHTKVDIGRPATDATTG